MKTKLISLQTILLTVLVLFIFSASTNAQVQWGQVSVSPNV